MEYKSFNHNEIEKCKLSGKNIDTIKDRYSIILDCDGEKIYSVGFYKTEFLRDLVKGNLKKVKTTLLEKQRSIARRMLEKLNIGKSVKV